MIIYFKFLNQLNRTVNSFNLTTIGSTHNKKFTIVDCALSIALEAMMGGLSSFCLSKETIFNKSQIH
jgi:hypothetical protein